MITDTLLNSLKSLFSSLGAKATDSNYAVGLFDKTSGEPKGLMGMSDLASVLGMNTLKMNFGETHDSFVQAVNKAPTRVLLVGLYEPGSTYLVIGYTIGDYASFIAFTYDGNAPMKLCYKFGGTWTWV